MQTARTEQLKETAPALSDLQEPLKLRCPRCGKVFSGQLDTPCPRCCPPPRLIKNPLSAE